MPVLHPQSLELRPDALRVLITGFGPFSVYKGSVNPSWLAVRKLHNTILYTQSPAIAVTLHNQTVGEPPAAPRQIHITTLEIPTSYDAVLTQVPGIHKRPPVLPTPSDHAFAIPAPPEKGYNFIMHVGVAPKGPLHLESKAHKSGYFKPDVDGKYAPEIPSASVPGNGYTKVSKNVEEVTHLTSQRGFAEGYEEFPEELYTKIAVEQLLQHLQESGVDPVRVSTDAGHYLCDFIYYCSLAEAQRQTVERSSEATPVFFMHCCPPNQPHSTEAVTDAIERIVTWVSARLN